jgi:penicillin-binding protein 2
MIEQYLKDSITEPDRKARIETIAKLNLMPPQILEEIRKKDSIDHAKKSKQLLRESDIKNLSDTMGIEQDENSNTLDELNKANAQPLSTDSLPRKKEVKKNSDLNGILPDKQKEPHKIDSSK